MLFLSNRISNIPQLDTNSYTDFYIPTSYKQNVLSTTNNHLYKIATQIVLQSMCGCQKTAINDHLA